MLLECCYMFQKRVMCTKFDIYVFITITGRYHCWWTIRSTSHGGDRKTFEVITSTCLYEGNPDRNHKLWNIVVKYRYGTVHL